ncbi:MAG: hypothetical protein AAF480_17970 [Actinomycetota bacterium]
MILGAVALVIVARPLVGAYRASIPEVVATWDAAERPTAFDADLQALLWEAEFVDSGAHLIEIGGFEAVMHLWQRADGTVVTGLTRPDGSLPAHYVTTLLGEGRGWLESRTTDRTPGPRQELMQVVPDAGLEELLRTHDRALGTIVSLGVSPVRSIEPFQVHLVQGKATRRSLRHNPLRWFFAQIAKTVSPDRPSTVAMGPTLDRRLRALRLS